MILLDTHIWVWWVHGDEHLSVHLKEVLRSHEPDGLGVSAISCWEVSQLIALGRVVLPCRVEDWTDQALAYPGIRLLPLTLEIAREANILPPGLGPDLADRLIVATARLEGISLVTTDEHLLAYEHVVTVS